MAASISSPAELPDTRRLRVRATVLYAVGCLLSVAWGLSADLFLDNALGASASVQSTPDGRTFLLVVNEADFTWQDVRLEVDDRWFYRLPGVPPGGQIDARLADFRNEYALPRPPDMFYWERVDAPAEQATAPLDHQPRRIVIAARQGQVELVLTR